MYACMVLWLLPGPAKRCICLLIYIYIYMYIYIHTYWHVHMQICPLKYKYMYMYVYMCVCVLHTRLHTWIWVHNCLRVCIYVLQNIECVTSILGKAYTHANNSYMYVYICIYVYIYTHTHTHYTHTTHTRIGICTCGDVRGYLIWRVSLFACMYVWKDFTMFHTHPHTHAGAHARAHTNDLLIDGKTACVCKWMFEYVHVCSQFLTLCQLQCPAGKYSLSGASTCTEVRRV
jgi:hypothetical protein